MISSEKWMILAPLQKLPKNVESLGKLIVAKGFKKLPKVQKIANSGHTGWKCIVEFLRIHKIGFSAFLYLNDLLFKKLLEQLCQGARIAI